MTRLPAEISSIIPATANITSTGTSPLYRPRSRRNGQAYTSEIADTKHTPTLSTSAMLSRMNMPDSTVPCPPQPATNSTPTSTSVQIARTWVSTRCFSSRNRSSIKSANAAPTSTSSGSSGNRSATVGMSCIIGSAP